MGNATHGIYEDGVVFYLQGPAGVGMSARAGSSRCAHFAGGRMKVELAKLGNRYSVEMWFSNGLPTDAREFTGFLFSRGRDDSGKADADRLGIGGVFDDSTAKGKIVFAASAPPKNVLTGASTVPLRTWNHLVLVRDHRRVLVYLNGNQRPEIDAQVVASSQRHASAVFIGGSSDGSFNFEGKIAKVAIFDRLLTQEEIASHYQARTSRRLGLSLRSEQVRTEGLKSLSFGKGQ